MASELDEGAYLNRIGEGVPLAPGREALAPLHRAPWAAFPFEDPDTLPQPAHQPVVPASVGLVLSGATRFRQPEF